MAGLAAGLLDRKVRIERDGASTHDGLQNVPGAPLVLADVWASIRPVGGEERYLNAEDAASVKSVVRIRWTKALDPDAPEGVRPSDRLRYPARDDGALYDIQSAIEIGRREGIELAVTRRA